MTRDEFEKLADGSTVAYGHPVGTVVRRTATKEIHWPDGVVSRFIGSVGEREFIKDLVLVSTVEKLQPRPLTPNEQLLIGELEKAVNIIEDLERRLARHERAKRDGGASARAAIAKVRGG